MTAQDRHRSAIGARIRAAREGHGLTLKALADSMGVTPSLLSQVETDKVLPSLNTLYRLALRLELSVDDLLELGPRAPATAVAARPTAVAADSPAVQRREHNPTLDMANGVRWERLAGGTSDGVEPLFITYAPHSHSSYDGSLMRQRGYEFGVLLEGTLSLTLGAETHVLRAGDSVHFDNSLPHVYVNDSDEEAKGVWFAIRGGLLHIPGAVTTGDRRDGRSLIDVLRALDPREDG